MSVPSRQSPIDLDDLRLLLAVAETGTLAGGARRVRVNHASAWRRLGALEARLATRLFDRQRSGYAATPAGELAIEGARRTLSELDALERRLAGQDVRPQGVVRLTMAETLVDLVAPVLKALRGSHPGLIVEVTTANSFLTLTRRDADVALRPAMTPPEGLIARRLTTVATAVYAARGEGGRPRDILHQDWLAPDDSLSHLGSARWIATHVPPERIVHRAGSLLALASAARAGLGVAALPCFMGDPDHGLRRVEPPLSEMATPLWLLTHPDLRNTARIRTVLDALAEALLRRRALLEGVRA